MRINYHRYAPAGPGAHFSGADHAGFTPRDWRARTYSPPLDDSESDDAADVWSAWVDLGGEG